ncbi:dihydropteroate synthase [bacterium]|nr:dihydropteroate synthase [bacterium]
MGQHIIRAGSYTLSTASKTLIMGILNVTPDSFSDGGLYDSPDKAVERALEMEDQGADLIDIGGESSRPFSDGISATEELGRIMPIIDRLVPRLKVPISVDTSKAEVAREALQAGVSMINDISALTVAPQMVELIRDFRAGLVLMHMQKTPQDMQVQPQYTNVVLEVKDYLAERIHWVCEQGVLPEQIIIDPGIGFGKTAMHNLQLINNLNHWTELHRPILIGASRKSFINTILETPVNDRLEGSLAAAIMAVVRGAGLVRVHDVKETFRALKIADAIVRA